MSLPPLATVTDLADLGMPVSDEEAGPAGRFLAAASAAIREAAGGPIGQTVSTVTLAGSRGGWLALPGPPVTAVSAVDVDDEPVDDGTYRVHPGGLLRPAGWGGDMATVTVTYTHGLPEVPADIVLLVCRIAAATLLALRAEPDGAGLAVRRITQERIGDYAVTYDRASGVTEMELPEVLQAQLRSRFGGGAGMVSQR
ncbi:hypothetical protein [Streptomyces bohaiensis]|uniref:hypothetical protein n=1 Tax=Streptomyces bohaiensis TaxID=1431344 RepID=UPI003B7A3F26